MTCAERTVNTVNAVRQQAQKSTDCSMVVNGEEGGTGFGEILGNASAIIKRRLGVATGSHIVPATQQRMEETFCHGDRYGSLIHRGNGTGKWKVSRVQFAVGASLK